MHTIQLTDNELLVLQDILENAETGRDISGLMDLYTDETLGPKETNKCVLSILNKLGMTELEGKLTEYYQDDEDEE